MCSKLLRRLILLRELKSCPGFADHHCFTSFSAFSEYNHERQLDHRLKNVKRDFSLCLHRTADHDSLKDEAAEKSSVQGENKGYPNEDHSNFKLIYKYPHMRQTYQISVITRYQCIFFASATPIVLYQYFVDGLSLLAASTVCGISGVFTCAMLLYLNKIKTRIGYMWVSSDYTQIKIAHLTLYGQRRDVIFSVNLNLPAAPTLEYSNHYARIKFSDSKAVYEMALKDGQIVDEKLFLKTFGPTALSMFENRKRY